jgi:hypothetical protein
MLLENLIVWGPILGKNAKLKKKKNWGNHLFKTPIL